MRNALLFLMLLPFSALAEGPLVATITASSGASANLQLRSGLRYELQCDVDSRFVTGTGNTTAAANSGTNKGRLVAAKGLYSFSTEATDRYVAVIAADGSSTAHCDVWEHARQPRG